MVIVCDAGETFVIDTPVARPPYERLQGLEVDVNEVFPLSPGNGSPESPRPAVLVASWFRPSACSRPTLG